MDGWMDGMMLLRFVLYCMCLSYCWCGQIEILASDDYKVVLYCIVDWWVFRVNLTCCYTCLYYSTAEFWVRRSFSITITLRVVLDVKSQDYNIMNARILTHCCFYSNHLNILWLLWWTVHKKRIFFFFFWNGVIVDMVTFSVNWR